MQDAPRVSKHSFLPYLFSCERKDRAVGGIHQLQICYDLSVSLRLTAPLEGEPFVVCIYIGAGQCYTVYIMVFSERNDIHGSACKAGTLTTEFL